ADKKARGLGDAILPCLRAPASFKRLLGGAAPALRRASHPPSSAAPPRQRGQSGTSEARGPCSRWRRDPQALRPRPDTRESRRVSEACPVRATWNKGLGPHWNPIALVVL